MQHVEDFSCAEAFGALNNVVVLGAGFVDDIGLGSSTKAALMLCWGTSVCDHTVFESCEMVDLITICFGDRNRKCAEAFTKIDLTEDHNGSTQNGNKICLSEKYCKW